MTGDARRRADAAAPARAARLRAPRRRGARWPPRRSAAAGCGCATRRFARGRRGSWSPARRRARRHAGPRGARRRRARHDHAARREAALRAAVAPFRLGRRPRVETDFPHGLRIEVVEHAPVAALEVGGAQSAASGVGAHARGVQADADLPVVDDAPPAGDAGRRRAHARRARRRRRRAARAARARPSGSGRPRGR